MKNKFVTAVFFTVCWGLLGSLALAQQTAEIVRGELKMDVHIPGIFVADDKDEIKVVPSKYRGELIVTKILVEGVTVKQGDVLMEFASDELDNAIEEAENEATDAAVELKKAQAEHESAKIDLQAKQAQLQKELEFSQQAVAAAIAKQQLELDKKLKEIADTENQLNNFRIDYETLKQIYEERNLRTSTSGDILIQREEQRIDNTKKGLDFRKKQLAYFQKFDKSKAQLEKELEVEKKQAEIKKQKIQLAAAVAEKQSEVDKAARKLAIANEKTENLKEDRQLLRVISPRDGILFFGSTGNELPAGVIVSGMPDIRKQLRVGGRVRTHTVLLTIATMDNLSIKMNVLENDVQHLQQDLPISVYPDAFPGTVFGGKLTKVDQTATKVSFTSRERRFKVMGKCADEANELRSGMNCRVVVHPKAMSDVILAPVVSVYAEDGKYYCFVKRESEPEKREVQVGYSNADRVQIIEGLQPGDLVYLKKPTE